MNVLIRDIDENTKWNEVVGLLDLFTTKKEFANELKEKRKIIFDDERLNLTNPIIVGIQDNGNMYVEFIKKDGN